MTRLWTDGAEMGDTLFWDVLAGAVTASTTEERSGDYSYALDAGEGVTKNITAISEAYVRVGYFHDDYNTNTRLISLRTGATDVMSLRVSATNQLVAYVSSTLTATSVQAIADDTWFLLELYFKQDDAPNGRIVAKIDGVTWIDYTGDTKPGAGTTFDNFYSYSGTATNYLDDLGMNDTVGAADNSWLGEGKIVSIYPNGDGTTNDWDGSDGDGVNNYLLVDEVPKDDDTTYVYTDGATATTEDQYNLSDYSGSGKTILRIYTEARARKTSADAASLKLGFLVSGGTDRLSAARSLTTTYARYVGDEHTVNPETAAAWSEANLDALELVLETG